MKRFLIITIIIIAGSCSRDEIIIFTPVGVTEAATNITENSAILNGMVNSYGGSTKVSFVYYEDSIQNESKIVEANPGTVTGDKFVKVSAEIAGLSPGTTYLYRLSLSWWWVIPTEIEAFATNHPPDQIYQGGIKFYVDNTGQHGLIAAPNDQSIGIEWSYGSFILTNAIGTAIGTGKANTSTIVTTIGVGSYAAKICDDLVLNGYDDWFLPSKDELDTLYKQRNMVGGFAHSYYWSSSESSASSAWTQDFMSGIQDSGPTKLSNDLNVRAIRAF
jgi:hypothetical protein